MKLRMPSRSWVAARSLSCSGVSMPAEERSASKTRMRYERLASRGAAVFLNSHLLSEVEQVKIMEKILSEDEESLKGDSILKEIVDRERFRSIVKSSSS